MNIASLRTFLTIANSGGFHAASTYLNVTQATVSARIKTLEDHLGQPLFIRGRGGTRLTQAGHDFLPHVERMIMAWDQAQAQIGGKKGDVMRLRLGVQLTVWAHLLLDWAIVIEESAEGAMLQLEFDYKSDIQEDVLKRKLDAGISEMPKNSPDLHALPLFNETLVLVSNRPAALGDPDLPDFIDMDWGSDFAAKSRPLAAQFPSPTISIGNGDMGLMYLMKKGGMGFFPRRNIRSHLRGGRLFPVQGVPSIDVPTYLVCRQDHPKREFLRKSVEKVQMKKPGPASRRPV